MEKRLLEMVVICQEGGNKLIEKVDVDSVVGDIEPTSMLYYAHPSPKLMDHPGRVLFDNIRSFVMQRTINRIHILDWFARHVNGGDLSKVDVPLIFGILCDYIDLHPYDYELLKRGLERERLVYYDNSDYFMNGTICVNDDGSYHYPSDEL